MKADSTVLSPEIQQHIEVMQQIKPVVQHAVENLLVEPETCWQPTDFLPAMDAENALEQIAALKERCADIPDSIITSLVGNMITEEALPSYQTYFNMVEGVNPERNLTTDNPWVKWSRMWTAEENRHGDLLNKYLYLSGRANMREVEETIHRLISNGFSPETNHDPYQAIIYTSFQERATKISHVNTGKLAHKAGDNVLSKICKTIAGDEARHEKAYKSFMSSIFEIDPTGAVIAFASSMKTQIVMPAVLMDKGGNKPNLYADFSAITQKIGVYTTWDYAAIIEHLVSLWKVDHLTGLKDGAAKAQDFLCNLASRYKRIAERMKVPDEIHLSWLSGNTAALKFL